MSQLLKDAKFIQLTCRMPEIDDKTNNNHSERREIEPVRGVMLYTSLDTSHPH